MKKKKTEIRSESFVKNKSSTHKIKTKRMEIFHLRQWDYHKFVRQWLRRIQIVRGAWIWIGCGYFRYCRFNHSEIHVLGLSFAYSVISVQQLLTTGVQDSGVVTYIYGSGSQSVNINVSNYLCIIHTGETFAPYRLQNVTLASAFFPVCWLNMWHVS